MQRYVKGEAYAQPPGRSTEGYLRSSLRSTPADAPLTEVMHPEVDIQAAPAASPEPTEDAADKRFAIQPSEPSKQEFSAPFAEWDPTR